MSELCEGKCCRTGALRNLLCGASRTPKQPCFPAASKRVIVRIFYFSPPLLDHSNSFSAASPPRHCCKTSSEPSAAAGRPAGFSTMKLAALLALCCLLRLSDCAPPTCYSRALGLSKEVMTLLDKIHTSERTVSAPKHARAHVLCVSRPLLCLPTSRKRVPKFCPRSSLTCT